ncbi:MAG TPA: PilZ domain-containing protein [Treponema sp.]|nr:PilZ domain-containing protein [Treponema sp.]
MKNEHRKEERFTDTGRVDAQELCVLPGVLDDISASGCRIHFPVPVKVDMENDYSIKMKIPRKEFLLPFSLLCRPRWITNSENRSNIGFSFLCSPGTPLLLRYIDFLKAASKKEADSLFD